MRTRFKLPPKWEREYYPAAFREYKILMQGRQYGDEASRDSWNWFLAGWTAYKNRKAPAPQMKDFTVKVLKD